MTLPTKNAGAFLRGGKIFIQPVKRLGNYGLRASPPVLVADEHERGLGSLVLLALSKSTEGPAPPTPKNESDCPLLKAAGFRSHEAFSDTAKYVWIDQQDGIITFIPSRNGGPGDRFLSLKKKIHCQPIEAQVESALRAAFDACEW
jgi:hypothetical protein